MTEERTSLKEIQRKIDEMGLKWKAGKTNLAELSSEERKKKLGLIPNEEEKTALKKKGLDK